MHSVDAIEDKDKKTLQKILNTEFGQRIDGARFCIYRSDECNKSANSHSVPMHAISRIADNKKKVLTIDRSNFSDQSNELIFTEVPITSFSTTRSFCRFHDKAVFAPIEDKEIVPDPEQNNLLILRALTYQRYQNHSQSGIIRKMSRLQHRNYRDIDYQLEIKNRKSLNHLLDDEIVNIKSELSSREFGGYQGSFTRLQDVPDVMCCETFRLSVLSPTRRTKRLSFLTVTVAADRIGGYVHWGMKSGDVEAVAYKDRIMRRGRYSPLVLHLFGLNENFCFANDWYTKLRITHKSKLARINSLYSREGETAREAILHCVTNSHLEIVEWKDLTTSST